MDLAVSPLRIAVIAAAVAWPLAAGLAVVMWSRGRAARHAVRAADLDARLRGFFRTVELRAAPPALASVIDTLEADAAIGPPLAAPPARGGSSAARPEG